MIADGKDYIATNDIMTTDQLRDFLDYEPDEILPDTIPVCSGEWRKEPDGVTWRAYDHPLD